MMCLLAAMVAARPSITWYGPATVTAAIPFQGNPYDPADNDVDVDFVSENGAKVRRLAYYVGDGKFSSTLVASSPGSFTPHFVLNGHSVGPTLSPVRVDTPLPHGFIGLRGRRFAWSDGTPYFPIGYDYGWRNGNGETVAQGMKKMGRSGANWSRIWTSHWDNKNPFWPSPSEKVAPRELRQSPLKIWDDICASAEKAGVSFQFVLFHHGPYSTTTDSNWADHPWNTKNGGFLADPTDVFVNEEAKRRSKIWLRYAVARYASSPAVMAWELFNEVQWVDAIKKNPARVGDVASWHREMAAYVRSLDPYHHLLTSSSSESLDNHIFDSVDYMQPHTYPANVLASIGGYEFKKKPGFFGEFGPPGGGNVRKLVRDGIYGGILAGHAGAGEYWFWDQVDRNGLAPDYRAARRVIDESGLLKHPGAKPLAIWVDTPRHGDMVLSAGKGWGESTVSELDLPRVGVKTLAGWSQYFQSLDGGQKRWAKPFLIRFNAPAAGKMTLNVGQISPKGGTLTAWVNDAKRLDLKMDPPAPSTGRRRPAAVPLSIDYPAGPVVIRLENHGGDWIRLDSVTVPAVGPTAMGHGLGDPTWVLVRIVGSDTSAVTVSGLSLKDGRYAAKIFDAANGETTTKPVDVQGGQVALQGLPADCVIDIS